ALQHIVTGIVDNPDDARIDETAPSGGDVVDGPVAEEDRGRVIGRGGRTAKAIRTVAAALAGDRRIRVDVADD
ncbi:KH domain-containing protein, partial [Microbacterium gubbeenense]|uniref:KH domain-containing protein n=1 Tax=Microbacterium gubbeenense TaxID=159896 RepID=UPI003F9CBB08